MSLIVSGTTLHTSESPLAATFQDAVCSLCVRHGCQSLSYSLVQPGLKYFESKEGMVAYRRRFGVMLALGNPLASEQQTPAILEKFIQAHPGPMLFAQVEGSAAESLRKLGFRVTPMGVDNSIHVQEFSLDGKEKADLRRYRNRAQAADITVAEAVDTPALRAELADISRAWIQSQRVHTRELEFLDRPLSLQPEPDVRIFVAERANRIVAFVILDPMYDEGHITGYTASILRRLPDTPMGTLDYIIIKAIEVLRAEGTETLSLGVSPMAEMGATAQKHGYGALPLYAICRTLYRLPWQPFVSIRGLSFHKSRYRPETRPIYVASRGGIGVGEMAALLRACRII